MTVLLHQQPASVSVKNPVFDALKEKVDNLTAKVAVVGLGYVGVPLAVCVAKEGYTVTGIDINQKRVEQLNAGTSYINDVPGSEVAELVVAEKLQATNSFSALANADVIVVCVPTPLSKNREPDISYIVETTRQIAAHLRQGQLITLESTTYPGTTEEEMLPLLEKTGLKVGEDFFLSYSPERVDPGNKLFNTQNTNKVLGGATPLCLQVSQAFYKKIILDIVTVSSPTCAELVKVFENTFRAVNVALVNELALLCDRMNLNIWEVVEAAGTKPFGMMSFSPGPGVGGHCIPVDPFYLSWKAKEFNFNTRFIELAGEINNLMPYFVREKLIRGLSQVKKPLGNANVLLLGMAYKKDVSDYRESPAIELCKVLHQDKVNILYMDPCIDTIELPWGETKQSMPLTAETLQNVDAVVIMTAHSDIDWQFVVSNSPVVIDTRNACQHVIEDREKIVLL